MPSNRHRTQEVEMGCDDVMCFLSFRAVFFVLYCCSCFVWPASKLFLQRIATKCDLLEREMRLLLFPAKKKKTEGPQTKTNNDKS